MITKIKLVHIISNLSQGGAQLLLFDILKNLKSKKDLEITVITLDSGEYIGKFDSEGIKTFDLNLKGLVNPRIYFKLKKFLKDLNPDIVHTHLHKADFYGRIAARHLKVPVIISTCHNYSTSHKNADMSKRSFFDIVDNFVIRHSGSYLIAISGVVKEYLIRRDKELVHKTEVIYNGVDISKEKYVLSECTEREEFKRKAGLEKGDFVITITGRLEEQKGHLFFLKSMREIITKNKKIKILLVGDGSLKNDIKKYIVDNNLGASVILCGFVKDSQKYVEISDLIAVPSLWEGFGLVITEAMVKNKIVLASDVGGICEIIEDGETGYLFDSNNKESLFNKFNFIYENFNKLDFIKENAQKLVKQRFDIRKNSELYYQYYLNKLSNITIRHSNDTKSFLLNTHII